MTEEAASAETPTRVASYEILEPIGKGGMGKVYKARAPDGSLIALKVLAPHLVDNDVQRMRFYQEARIAMQLDHPNMVRAIEVGEDEGRHFIAMEFVDGETLRQRIRRGGPLREKDAIRIIAQIAQALHKAHKRGLIHRDVKPDNILIPKEGPAKLSDLGLVKSLDADLNLTKTGRGLGTPHYMAPEQFRDAKNVDIRSDIYSLGATLYVAVTGETPFGGGPPLETFLKKSKNAYIPPKTLNPRLSARVVEAIERAMDADPARRPATARAFAEMLVGTDAGGVDADGDDEPTWFVLVPDRHGENRKIKGKESMVALQIRRGRLGPAVLASTSREGPFRRLDEIDAFRQCLLEQGKAVAADEDFVEVEPDSNLSAPSSTLARALAAGLGRRWWWIALAAALTGAVLWFVAF